LHADGLSYRLIARNVGLSKNTVMAIVKRGAAVLSTVGCAHESLKCCLVGSRAPLTEAPAREESLLRLRRNVLTVAAAAHI
jgi:hypothetical protein